jgi:creatinine amidohydrolase
MSPLFKEINWMNVEKYLETDKRVVVTIGSCEQHGYLSLLTDTLVAAKVAQEACTKEGVLMAPPLPYGLSSAFLGYPGTISLTPITFIAVIQEILDNLVSHGFQKILINNGHGGNSGVLEWIQDDYNNKNQAVRVSTFTYWNHPIVIEFSKTLEFEANHANWGENFPFTRVGPVPEGEKEGKKEWPRAARAADYREFLGDGSFGGKYQVLDEVMDQLFHSAVNAMIAELQLL